MTPPTHSPLAMPPPGYVVYRDNLPDGSFDPTAPPIFFPPKDSDELFDALRAKYSHLKSHSERMRDAVIEFLLEEQQTELATGISPIAPTETPATSPWQQSWPSMTSTSTSSSWSSPELFDLGTPDFSGGSSHFHLPQPSTQQSVAGASTAGSTEPEAPALERMTGVFSLSSATQPKQHVRRKMTEAEKIEYRKRRIVKACETCARRKRKCIHGQPEMDGLSRKSTRKISKQQSVALKMSSITSSAKQNEAVIKSSTPGDTPGVDYPCDHDMQLFDDFTNLFDDPTLDMNLDTLLPTSDQAWDTAQLQNNVQSLHSDFMNPNIGTKFNRGEHRQSANTEIPRYDWLDSEWIDQADQREQNRQVHAASDDFFMKSPHLSQSVAPPGQGQVPEDGRRSPDNDGLLWERSPTGRDLAFLEPTHTGHVHDTEGSWAYVYDSAGRTSSGARGPQCPRTALAQIVLRLIGTVKAVRAFGSLLDPRSPSTLRSASIGAVATAIILKDIPITAGDPPGNQVRAGVARQCSINASHALLPAADRSGLYQSGSESRVRTSTSVSDASGAVQYNGPKAQEGRPLTLASVKRSARTQSPCLASYRMQQSAQGERDKVAQRPLTPRDTVPTDLMSNWQKPAARCWHSTDPNCATSLCHIRRFVVLPRISDPVESRQKPALSKDPRNSSNNVRLRQGRGAWPASDSLHRTTGTLQFQSAPPGPEFSALNDQPFANYTLPPAYALSERASDFIESWSVRIGRAGTAAGSVMMERSHTAQAHDTSSAFSNAASNGATEVHVGRLRDYFKVKDHHGRVQAQEEKKRDTKRYRDHHGRLPVQFKAKRTSKRCSDQSWSTLLRFSPSEPAQFFWRHVALVAWAALLITAFAFAYGNMRSAVLLALAVSFLFRDGSARGTSWNLAWYCCNCWWWTSTAKSVQAIWKAWGKLAGSEPNHLGQKAETCLRIWRWMGPV